MTCSKRSSERLKMKVLDVLNAAGPVLLRTLTHLPVRKPEPSRLRSCIVA
jgi:hypothetical protein